MAALPPVVTPVKHPSRRELILAELERLTNARVLHGSESLCKMLRYLALQALDRPGVPVKEYQIATEVFGRPHDFDPQSDSAIRVQAGRLRAKLTEYYTSEGVEDPLVVEMPKGSYVLSFRDRTAEVLPVDSPVELAPASGAFGKPAKPSPWAAAFAVMCVLFLAAVVTIGALVRRPVIPHAVAAPNLPALRAFWGQFATGPDEPWVIYSNADFVGRPETGMRYYNPARDENRRVFDQYTGVGEVLAVHSLDVAFDELHKQLRVKRGSLFSLDDANNRDLIFVGSPSENLTLQEIPTTKDFVFQRVASGPRRGDLGIVNVHPALGEAHDYLASPSADPMTEDYAVIAYLPGLNPARSVLICAGTTTFGTQAAVEYASHENTMEQLLARVGYRPGQKIAPFEALLHVSIAKGVPVESTLIAVRKRTD